MAVVETVRGPVDTGDLGRTYMHEHVFVLTPDVQQNYPADWGREEDRVDDAVVKLKALAGQGMRTIADPTVVGLGRYIPRIQRVAEQVPELNIIVATGCYTYDQVPFFFLYRRAGTHRRRGPRARSHGRHVHQRHNRRDHRHAGQGSLSQSVPLIAQGMTRGVARIMRAVARAHRQTGAPITVHTHPGTHAGLAVKTAAVRRGGSRPGPGRARPQRRQHRRRALERAGEHGFILGMDRFGLNLETTFEARADTRRRAVPAWLRRPDGPGPRRLVLSWTG